MSQENVKVVQRLYEAASDTPDFPPGLIAPDAEIDARDASPDIGIVSDPADSIQAIRTYAEMFDSFHVELEAVLHADASKVVTAVVDGGRIKGSDREIHNRFFHCFIFRDGVVVRWSTHRTEVKALEAAGLSE